MERLVRLTVAQWSRVQPLLPCISKKGGRPRKADRPMVEAMLWILRTGAPWRDLPSSYGPWGSVYTRFSRWSASGVLAQLFEALARERDGEGYLIDATIVRAHQDASGAAKEGAQEIGRSRGGPSTKIHAVVDALGNPVRLALSPGQTHEMKLAYELLGDITDAYVAGDKAYDAAPLVQLLERNRCTVVIPSKADRAGQRKIDRHLYKERRLVDGLTRSRVTGAEPENLSPSPPSPLPEGEGCRHSQATSGSGRPIRPPCRVCCSP